MGGTTRTARESPTRVGGINNTKKKKKKGEGNGDTCDPSTPFYRTSTQRIGSTDGVTRVLVTIGHPQKLLALNDL
jgi:hypothetical protein